MVTEEVLVSQCNVHSFNILIKLLAFPARLVSLKFTLVTIQQNVELGVKLSKWPNGLQLLTAIDCYC